MAYEKNYGFVSSGATIEKYAAELTEKAKGEYTHERI